MFGHFFQKSLGDRHRAGQDTHLPIVANHAQQERILFRGCARAKRVVR